MASPPGDPLDEIRAALPPGYSIARFIKAGGQGAVLEGVRNGERVAIKLFDPTSDRRRLEREVSLLCALSSPFLVTVKDFDNLVLRGQQVPFVAFEYVDGRDLRDALIGVTSRPDLSTLTQIGAHVGTALEVLWRHRVVHRDVKPDNIIQAQDGRFVLVDLGLAQHLVRATITAPHASPGTVGYRSPEQQRGRRRLTIHSDVFSLGITLYEAASGVHPWQRMEHAMAFNSPAPLVSKRPDLPLWFCQAVHRMLALQPGVRPTSPSQLFGSGGGA